MPSNVAAIPSNIATWKSNIRTDLASILLKGFDACMACFTFAGFGESNSGLTKSKNMYFKASVASLEYHGS